MNMRWIAGIILALAMAAPALAAEEYPPKETLEASIYRGEIVYYNYCVLCHGLTAEGNGRAAKMYNPKPANLVLSDKNDLYKEMIIRRGGEAMGRSKFMPPWGNELTDEQITDVIAYLASINKAQKK
jgi:mono/diheme cytochrome c family protein